jgi:hypothetical protein
MACGDEEGEGLLGEIAGYLDDCAVAHAAGLRAEPHATVEELCEALGGMSPEGMAECLAILAASGDAEVGLVAGEWRSR